MKKIFLLSTLAIAAMACTETPGYTITGTVDNAEMNGKYVFLYAKEANGDVLLDSAIIEGGSFHLEGVQKGKTLAMITTKAKKLQQRANGVNAAYTPVFVHENAEFQTVFSETPTLTGTPENDAYNALQSQIRELRSKQTESNYEQINGQIKEKVKAYAAKAPESLITAKLLMDFRYDLSEKTRREILAKSNGHFSVVSGISAMEKQLKTLETVAVGKPFTDFSMNDLQGKSVKLADFVGKGKVVLIDFWASWCPPCRRDMPHLVALHKEYADKGFDIVGVSLDSKQEAWEKGVKDLHITWTQMSDLKGWKNVGAALYGVNSIPHTVLVTKDGIIAAKSLHGEKLEEKIQELLK